MFRPCAFQFQLADNAHRRKVPCITMCPCGFDLLTLKRHAHRRKVPCITVCPCGFDLLTKTRNAHRRNVHLHYNVAELL